MAEILPCLLGCQRGQHKGVLCEFGKEDRDVLDEPKKGAYIDREFRDWPLQDAINL